MAEDTSWRWSLMEEPLLHGTGRLCSHALQSLLPALDASLAPQPVVTPKKKSKKKKGSKRTSLAVQEDAQPPQGPTLLWHEAAVSVAISPSCRILFSPIPSFCMCTDATAFSGIQDISSGSFVLLPTADPPGVSATALQAWWQDSHASWIPQHLRDDFSMSGASVELAASAVRPAREVTLVLLSEWPKAKPCRTFLQDSLFSSLAGIRVLLAGTVVQAGAFVGASVASGRRPQLFVASTVPHGDGPLRITDKTLIHLADGETEAQPEKLVTERLREEESNLRPDASAVVLGMEDDEEELEKLLCVARDWRELFRQGGRGQGLAGPRGILLKGDAGVGKTYLAKKVIQRLGADVTVINGSEIIGTYVGESEEAIRDAFHEAGASKKQLSVLLIDGIDTLCPSRDDASQYEGRIVAQLLTLMDGIDSRTLRKCQGDGPVVVVVGVTSDADKLDPALRRHGRFDHEVLVGGGHAASFARRSRTLQSICKLMPMAEEFTGTGEGEGEAAYDALARRCIGFVAADLQLLCQEVGLHAFRGRGSTGIAKNGTGDKEGREKEASECRVGMRHFEEALLHVRPTKKTAVCIEVPNVTWSSIGGLDEVKESLQTRVLGPMKHRDAYTRMGLSVPRGVLLHGPPGCCKTTLVRALATAANATFISLNGAEVYSPYLGDAEATIRECFRQARAMQPCIVFFDEIDAIVGKRGVGGGSGTGMEERVLSTLLNELDGIGTAVATEVILVAATNRKDLIDDALLRPGRIDKVMYVPMPNTAERKMILEVKCAALPLAGDVDLDRLAASFTLGLSGAEIENLCREAALVALRADITATEVTMEHFRQAHTQQGGGAGDMGESGCRTS